MKYQVFSVQGTLLANTYHYGDAMTCYDNNPYAAIIKEEDRIILQRYEIINMIDTVIKQK